MKFFQVRFAPVHTLVIMLALSLLTLLGANHLAKREKEIRYTSDRIPLEKFAARLRKQIHQLDELYEKHLREIGSQLTGESFIDPWTVRKLGNNIYGIVQISHVKSDQPSHILMRNTSSAPKPIFSNERQFPNTVPITPTSASWINGPANYAVFWMRNADSKNVFAFTIDKNEVEKRTRGYLKEWIKFHPAPASLDRLSSIHSPVINKAEKANREADFFMLIPSRFGNWQILAWDHLKKETFYDWRIFAIGATFTTIFVLLGVFLFIQQKQSLRKAEQRVSFVNQVSHELGVPLTNILLNMELIEDHELPQEVSRRIGIAREEIRRLTRLVSNVLTFSRSDRGMLRLQVQNCIPDEVIDSVLEQYDPALRRKMISVSLKTDASKPVQTDADALAQIIANLVSNVEKYAAPGKFLEIESRIDNRELVVKVSDRGPGIQTSQKERIFLPFERAENHTNQGSTGAGLGLAIARDLALKLGGHISLLSSTIGAQFELRIPVSHTDVS